MPRLSKARFTRLEYNWKKSLVSDEILDFRQMHTLLKMENGGGKSVLTQMMLSAYLTGRKRNFNSRQFSEYFSGPKPTFLLQEWARDGQAGYFCVGQMIRQAQSIREEAGLEERNDNRLDHMVWIAEYKDPADEISLQSLELLEVLPNGRRAFLQYQDARSMLENFARERSSEFRLYNMNNTSQRRAYFERLEQLGIRLSEMSQLREFNQEESGISRFNSTFNTEDKLVRKVLIPAVEERLDADAGAAQNGGHTEIFRQSFTSLLEEKHRNRQNLILVKVLSRLETDLEESHQLSLRRMLEQKQLQARLMDLRLLYEGIAQAEGVFALQQQDLEDFLDICRAELVRIAHQLLSIRFHDNEKQLLQVQSVLESLQADSSKRTEQLQSLEVENKKLKCASVLQAVHKAAREEKTAEEKRKAALLSSEETARRQNAVGAALSILYEQDLQEAETRLQDTLAQKQETQKALTEARKENAASQSRLMALTSQTAVCENRLKAYRKEEEAFLKKNGLVIRHTLSFWEDLEAYHELQSTLQQDLAGQEQENQRLETGLQTSRQKQTQYAEQAQSARLQLKDLEHQMDQARQSQKELERRKELRLKLLAMLGMQEEDLWNEKALDQTFRRSVQSIQDQMASVNRAISDLERKLRQLSTGTSLELSEDILAVMEELGIEVQTGTDLLRTWKMPPTRKEKFISEHPFLPYSLIMEDTQKDALLALLQQRQINTSMPIPILSREALNQEEKLEGSLSFYLRFNSQLIFASTLEKLKQEAREALEAQKKYLSLQQRDLSALENALFSTQQNPVTLKELEDGLKLQEQLEKKKQKTQDTLQEAAILEQKEKKYAEELSALLKKGQRALQKLEQLCARMQELVLSYQEACTVHGSLQKTEEEIIQVQAQKQVLEEKLAGLEQQLEKQNQMTYEQRKTRQDALELAESFRRFASYEPVSGDRLSLEASYDSLQTELNQSQAGEFTRQMEEARREKHRRQKQLQKYLTSYGLQQEVIEPVSWSEDLELENEEQISQLRQDLQALSEQILKSTAEESSLQTTRRSLLEKIQEETGQSKPLEPDQIPAGDLEAARQDLLRENDQSLRELNLLQDRREKFHQAGLRLLDIEGISELEPDEEAEIPDVQNIRLSELEERFSVLRVAWKHQIRALESTGQSLKNQLETLLRRYQKDNEYAEKTLQAILLRIDDVQGMNEEIEQKQRLLHTLLESIQTNLEKLRDKKEEVIQNLYGYLRSLHQQLKTIDMDTTVRIQDTHRKMLEISLPDWDGHDAMYKEKLTQYVEDGLDRLEKDEKEQDSQILALVRPENLYNNIVGISSIRIRLYKVEEFSQSRIDWHQAGKMSGAEGFLCALTVILAVLNYQHKTSADVLSRRKDASLLLLDNPFAYTQSAHIIDTMMKLADNMNTQMVAFTNVDNSAVLNAFDNIYSLRMIPRYDGKNYLNVSAMTAPEIREAESVEVVLQSED